MKNPVPYVVRFPEEVDHLTPETEYFYVRLKDGEHRIRLHDYATLYLHPGLYEYVVTDQLQCRSPWVVTKLLMDEILRSEGDLSVVKVLDFGAGCGLAGEILRAQGVQSIVGLDRVPAAAEATLRDRPGIYESYFVGDICVLKPEMAVALQQYRFNTMICVSAMALGHIAPDAFVQAFNMISDGGWIAFNVFQDSMDGRSNPELSYFYEKVMNGECMQVLMAHSYDHRLMMNGKRIKNLAVVGKKQKRLSARKPLTCSYEGH